MSLAVRSRSDGILKGADLLLFPGPSFFLMYCKICHILRNGSSEQLHTGIIFLSLLSERLNTSITEALNCNTGKHTHTIMSSIICMRYVLIQFQTIWVIMEQSLLYIQTLPHIQCNINSLSRECVCSVWVCNVSHYELPFHPEPTLSLVLPSIH